MSLPRILVIEDNPMDVLLLRSNLELTLGENHFEVLSDGAAALSFIFEHRAGMHSPDPCVIVLDLHLPKHNGIEVLTEVRRTPALVHINVVVLSGAIWGKQLEEIRALGA